MHAPLLALVLGVAAGGPAALEPVPADTVRVFLIRHGQALSNLDPKPSLPPDELDLLTPSAGRHPFRILNGSITAVDVGPEELPKLLFTSHLPESRVGP